MMVVTVKMDFDMPLFLVYIFFFFQLASGILLFIDALFCDWFMICLAVVVWYGRDTKEHQ
jgi:hypothetical protein